MKIEKLGHIVLHVRDRARSEAFYHGVLGLPIRVRYDPVPSTFFGIPGDHHLLAVIAIGEAAAAPPENGLGLRHVAFKIGENAAQLQQARREIEASGCKLKKALDHGITQSLYVEDPDGNTVELYVDVSDAWKLDPAEIVRPPKALTAA